MTVLAWPLDLPKPARDSWQSKRQDSRQKRSSENGPPGYRRRFSSVAREVSMSVTLTRSQKAVFDNFYDHDTKHGSLLFTMPDPTTDGWQMLTSDGTPVHDPEGNPSLLSAQWLCLFGETVPTETVIGIEFRITFSVTVMP